MMNNEKYSTPSLIPELYCADIAISLNFYTEILGFNIQYQRKDEGFAMLERQGACLMLDEINQTKRLWLTATLTKPFGRGINIQIKTTRVDALYHRIQDTSGHIFMPIEEKWYQAGACLISHRQFIVLDPDGYMLRFFEELDQ